MDNRWTDERLTKQFQVAQILWMTLLMTLGVYAVILFSKGEAATIALQDLWNDPTCRILTMVAGFDFLIGYFSFQFIFSPQRVQVIKQHQHPDRGSMIARLYSLFFTAKIVQWAIYESVAILGFMMAQIKQAPNVYGPFAALAAFGYVMSFPKKA